MRRTAAVLAFAFSAAAIFVGSAGSATSKSAFLVFVEPTQTAASNGLVLETEMAGTFNVADKTASGDGEFALLAGGSEIDHGTLTVTGMVAFQFYGCGEVTTPDGPISLPPDWCGGRVILRCERHTTPQMTATWTPSFALITPDTVRSGTERGILWWRRASS